MTASRANGPVILAVDVDRTSLNVIREALPEWTVQAVHEASAASLAQEGAIEKVDLLILGITQDVRKTLGLCRILRSESGRAGPALVVLLSPQQAMLGKEALESGADDCLFLPIQAAKLLDIVQRHRGLAPAGHAADPERIHLDRWQDEGGQG